MTWVKNTTKTCHLYLDSKEEDLFLIRTYKGKVFVAGYNKDNGFFYAEGIFMFEEENVEYFLPICLIDFPSE